MTTQANGDLTSLVGTTQAVITKSILGMKRASLTKSWVTVHAHFDRVRP
jgi:hypothetical protein